MAALSEQPPSPVKMRNALGWWWHTPHDTLDKIDEANLVRDTKVYVHTLQRLLTDPVLPLDFAAHARALLAELASLRATLIERFDLGSLIAAAEGLRAAASADGAVGPCADACVARAGSAVLHDRRSFHPRSGPAAAGLAGVAAVARPGEDRAGVG